MDSLFVFIFPNISSLLVVLVSWCCIICRYSSLHFLQTSKLVNSCLDALIEPIWHVKSRKRVHIKSTFHLLEVAFVVESPVFDLADLLLCEPLNALAFLPETKFGGGSRHGIRSQTVLLSTPPVTSVRAAIRPRVNSKSMLFVIFVLAAVLATILPCINTHAIHVIVDPLALILSPIQPRIDSKTLDFVLLPFSVVS